jgi:hypothetical protein
MQYSTAATALLGEREPTTVLARLLAAHGDDVAVDATAGGPVVRQSTWRLVRGLEAECVPEWFDGWRGLWEGVLAVVDRDLWLHVDRRLDRGDDEFSWTLRPTNRHLRF